MNQYVLLAETGADIPQDIREKYGIYIVPMHVTLGDETRDDGAFPVSELFDYYKRTKKLPKTSASNQYDFECVFDRIRREQPEAIIIYTAYSAVTTATYAAALSAMEGRSGIYAVDTKHVSGGETLCVLLTARYIKDHPEASPEEIISYVESIRGRVHMGFFPGDLDYLRAGGRVSNAAYMGAKILSLNPLIEVNNGFLVATKKYRGKMDRVARRLLADFTEEYHFSRDLLLMVWSEGLPEALKADLEKQARSQGFKEIRWIKTGGVISTHSGPGAFGVIGIEA